MSDTQFDDFETRWWMQKWQERDSVLRGQFGETAPPGEVTAFYWDDIDSRIPGGCAMTFVIDHFGKRRVLTIGHGLAQPLSSAEVFSSESRSGYGWEFGIVTDGMDDWRFSVLQQLMTYVRQSGRRIEPAHRVPFAFFTPKGGGVDAILGTAVPLSEGAEPRMVRSMVFWPLLGLSGNLRTSTGQFGILVGTTLTDNEVLLAKSTSSAHVLLLLLRSGVGQISDVDRSTVLDLPNAAREWSRIKNLSSGEAEDRLRERL